VLGHGKSLEKSIGLVVEGAKNVLKNEWQIEWIEWIEWMNEWNDMSVKYI
jgi:hypothetical protein